MPSSAPIQQRLFAHLERLADSDVTLDRDTDLVETLGLDSTEVIDLVLDIEDEFDVLVPMNELSHVCTAGELVDLIYRLSEESP